MKKLIIVGFICGVIGFVAGNAFWYLASPLWIDREVSETLADNVANQVLALGDFTDADRAHHGTGKVHLIDTGTGKLIRFTDFKVTNGPDLYVWLVKADGIEDSDDVKASEWVNLGALKGNIGNQNYPLPAGINLADYKSVVVWCRQFGVLFAKAELNS